jgi:hypothetical protein
LQNTIRFCASVITTPWLSWFRAKLINAFLRNCKRFALRSAECTHNATAARKELTTTPAISISQTMLGSAEPT